MVLFFLTIEKFAISNPKVNHNQKLINALSALKHFYYM